MQLCIAHHHLVHEGGWTVQLNADGALAFTAPDGRALPPEPPREMGSGDGAADSRGRWYTLVMAQPAAKSAFEDALAALRRDPMHPVRVHVEDMDVEMRAVRTPAPEIPLGDYLASLGPWEGESTEELLELLREGRRMGGSKEPPRDL